MSFSNDFGSDDVVSEINMTPLVDVMLVLLIIFMLTVPVITHSIHVDLPKTQSLTSEITPESIILSLTEQADIYWDDELITQQQLSERFSIAAQQVPQPQFQLRGARSVAYEHVVGVMAQAQSAGIAALGFQTDIKN